MSSPPPPEPCPKCGSPKSICVCDRITLLDTQRRVVVLQHPAEHDVVFGSAGIVQRSLKNALIVVGLSWRSLSHALSHEVEPSRWAVLYGGSLPRAAASAPKTDAAVSLFDRQGKPLPLTTRLDGIVLLDGTWSQAKALWWRNPWLLRHPRIVLHPRAPSAYGRLRAQSQRDHLATLEAAGLALTGLGENPAVEQQLLRVFRTMLQRVRDAQRESDPTVPSPPRTRHRAVRRERGGGPLD